MGKQISALFCLMGINVEIWVHKSSDKDDKNLVKSMRILSRVLNIKLSKIGSYTFIDNFEDVKSEVVVETILEDLSEKRKMYQFFENKEIAYFTNTSSLSPNDIGKHAYGLHFFNPISLKLVEIYYPEIHDLSLQFIIEPLKEHRFKVINVKDNRGYIGNYILFKEISSFFELIEKNNYSIQDLQAVYDSLHDGRNIISIINIIGVDVALNIIKNLNKVYQNFYIPKSFEIAIKNNILGKKNKTSINSILVNKNH